MNVHKKPPPPHIDPNRDGAKGSKNEKNLQKNSHRHEAEDFFVMVIDTKWSVYVKRHLSAGPGLLLSQTQLSLYVKAKHRAYWWFSHRHVNVNHTTSLSFRHFRQTSLLANYHETKLELSRRARSLIGIQSNYWIQQHKQEKSSGNEWGSWVQNKFTVTAQSRHAATATVASIYSFPVCFAIYHIKQMPPSGSRIDL